MLRKKFKLYLALFFYLVLFTEKIFAGNQDSLLVRKFYRCLYNYKFVSADSILKDMNTLGVDRDLVELSFITFSWWKIISGEDSKENVDNLFNSITSAISNIQEKSPSQEAVLQLIVLYSYKSRLHNYNNNKLSSFYAFKQSYNYFEKLTPCSSGTCDLYNFVAGMYYALGGHLQDEFPAALLGFDKSLADKELGYKYLKSGATSEFEQIRIESIYFLAKLYLEVQEKPEIACGYTRQLVEIFPGNLVFRFNHILTLYGQGKYGEAEVAYRELMEYSERNVQLSWQQKRHFEKEYNFLTK